MGSRPFLCPRVEYEKTSLSANRQGPVGQRLQGKGSSGKREAIGIEAFEKLEGPGVWVVFGEAARLENPHIACGIRRDPVGLAAGEALWRIFSIRKSGNIRPVESLGGIVCEEPDETFFILMELANMRRGRRLLVQQALEMDVVERSGEGAHGRAHRCDSETNA